MIGHLISEIINQIFPIKETYRFNSLPPMRSDTTATDMSAIDDFIVKVVELVQKKARLATDLLCYIICITIDLLCYIICITIGLLCYIIRITIDLLCYIIRITIDILCYSFA